MRRVLLTFALFGAAALAVNGLAAEDKRPDAAKDRDAKKLTIKEIGRLMKDTHHGAKTPDARTVAELKNESPDWEQLAKDAKAFTAMGEVLKANAPFGPSALRNDILSPTKYVASAAALTKAAGAKDKKAATAAFTALTKSCAACHCYDLPPELRRRL